MRQLDRALEALRRRARRSPRWTSCPTRRSARSCRRCRAGRRSRRSSSRGELIGGADIVEELRRAASWSAKLEEKLGADYRDAREEKTLTVV